MIPRNWNIERWQCWWLRVRSRWCWWLGKFSIFRPWLTVESKTMNNGGTSVLGFLGYTVSERPIWKQVCKQTSYLHILPAPRSASTFSKSWSLEARREVLLVGEWDQKIKRGEWWRETYCLGEEKEVTGSSLSADGKKSLGYDGQDKRLG